MNGTRKVMKRGWEKELIGYLNKGIWGFIPIYSEDGGNYTTLIFQNDNEVIVKKRVDTLIKGYAGFFQKDIGLIRGKAREITGQRNMNPLPIARDIIFVPFKYRKAVGKDDGTLAYFLHSAIDRVVDGEKEIRLLLRNDSSYKILDSQSTAKHRISVAHQIRHDLSNNEGRQSDDLTFLREPEDIYNLLPATKGDLVPIMKNLEDIANGLKELKR